MPKAKEFIEKYGLSLAADLRADASTDPKKAASHLEHYEACYLTYTPKVCVFSATTQCSLYSAGPKTCPAKCTGGETVKDKMISMYRHGKKNTPTKVEASHSAKFRRFGLASTDLYTKTAFVNQKLEMKQETQTSTLLLDSSLETLFGET